MASENLVNELFEIVQSNTKEKLSYDDFEKDLLKSINLKNDEIDRALSLMLSQAQVNPNIIGETKGGTFVISPSFSAAVISTIKYENQFIVGKSENIERNIINNNNDNILKDVLAANIIMSPELIDNMIQNYSSLSFEERDALWSNALTMDKKTLTNLRAAHNKKIMEYAEKADPSTAEKLMETVVENGDKEATADALEEGKKSAVVDIVERINNQLQNKSIDFESILMKIAATLNVSYVSGMDLNKLPLNMLKVVSKVLEIIEKRVFEHKLEGRPLDDLDISLNLDFLQNASNHGQALNQEDIERARKAQQYVNDNGFYNSSSEIERNKLQTMIGGITGGYTTLTITADQQRIVVENERKYRQTVGKKFSVEKSRARIEDFQEILNKIEGEESQKTDALQILNAILGKIDSKKISQVGFSLKDFVEREIQKLPEKEKYGSIILSFLAMQDQRYFLSMFRENPSSFRDVVLNGLVELRRSNKEPETFFTDYFKALNDIQALPIYDLVTPKKITREVEEETVGKKYVSDHEVDEYAHSHSENIEVDEEMLKKIADQTKETKRFGDVGKLQKEGKKPNDESKHQISALGNVDPTHSNDESETILELRDTYGGEFPRENPGVTFGEDGIADFGDFSSFFDSAEEKVDENPEKKDVEEPTVIDTLKDNIKKRAVFLSPKNKEQVIDSFSEVRTQQIKTEADIIIETMKDLDDIIKEAEEELGE